MGTWYFSVSTHLVDILRTPMNVEDEMPWSYETLWSEEKKGTKLCIYGEREHRKTYSRTAKGRQEVDDRTLVIAKGFFWRNRNSDKYHMLSIQNLMECYWKWMGNLKYEIRWKVVALRAWRWWKCQGHTCKNEINKCKTY